MWPHHVEAEPGPAAAASVAGRDGDGSQPQTLGCGQRQAGAGGKQPEGGRRLLCARERMGRIQDVKALKNRHLIRLPY
ncbi:unnamed protein product [Caretta caretta]